MNVVPVEVRFELPLSLLYKLDAQGRNKFTQEAVVKALGTIDFSSEYINHFDSDDYP